MWFFFSFFLLLSSRFVSSDGGWRMVKSATLTTLINLCSKSWLISDFRTRGRGGEAAES